MTDLKTFIERHHVTEVECLVPDINGIARGKILPDDKFLLGLKTQGMRLPEAIFIQTVTGDYPENEDVTDPATIDIYLVPDPQTIRVVPWYQEPTAQVICDTVYSDGSPVEIVEEPDAGSASASRVGSTTFASRRWRTALS